METFAAGAVVLVSFPFSDLTKSKLRPAVVLAYVGRNDHVLCQVTSKPYSDTTAIEIDETGLRSGSLQRVSYARPGKLFTTNARLISRQLGILKAQGQDAVVEAVVTLMRSGVGK